MCFACSLYQLCPSACSIYERTTGPGDPRNVLQDPNPWTWSEITDENLDDAMHARAVLVHTLPPRCDWDRVQSDKCFANYCLDQLPMPSAKV